MATLTKTTEVSRDWTSLLAGANGRTPDITLTTDLEAGLLVTVCPVEAVALADGILVTVEGRFGPGDEDWRDLYTLRMAAGTASTIDVDVEAAAGATVLPISATANFDTAGDKFFCRNSVLLANSEVVRNSGTAVNVSISLADALQNIQQTSADLFDIVAEKYFPLPNAVSKARVTYVNDDADCDVAIRVDVVRATEIA